MTQPSAAIHTPLSTTPPSPALSVYQGRGSLSVHQCRGTLSVHPGVGTLVACPPWVYPYWVPSGYQHLAVPAPAACHPLVDSSLSASPFLQAHQGPPYAGCRHAFAPALSAGSAHAPGGARPSGGLSVQHNKSLHVAGLWGKQKSNHE